MQRGRAFRFRRRVYLSQIAFGGIVAAALIRTGFDRVRTDGPLALPGDGPLGWMPAAVLLLTGGICAVWILGQALAMITKRRVLLVTEEGIRLGTQARETTPWSSVAGIRHIGNPVRPGLLDEWTIVLKEGERLPRGWFRRVVDAFVGAPSDRLSLRSRQIRPGSPVLVLAFDHLKPDEVPLEIYPSRAAWQTARAARRDVEPRSAGTLRRAR